MLNMIKIIELPQVGESVTEGVIGKWLVEPGQHVERYDPLVEVVTDKVSMEAPSPFTGVFVRALAEEGETVPMGQPICEMEVDGEDPSVVPPEAGRASARPHQPDPAASADPISFEEEAPAEDEPTGDAGRVGGAWAMPAANSEQEPPLPGGGGDEEAAQPAFEFMDSVRSVGPTGSGEHGEGRPDALQDAHVHIESAHEPAAPSVAEPDRSYVISPLVARLSAQYGIDLSTIEGTGTGGRITSKDLLEAVSRMTSQTEEASAEEEPAAGEVQAVAPEEAAEEAAPEDEAEAASPVIPAPPPVVPAEAGTSRPVGSAWAAHEETEEPAQAAEAEPVAEEDAAQPVADAEPPSPVIPAQAGIQGARAAHEETEEPAQAAEAEPLTEDVAEQEAEDAVPTEIGEELPSPVTPAPPPVVPAEAGTSQPVGDAWAAHEETEEPAQAAEAEPLTEDFAEQEAEDAALAIVDAEPPIPVIPAQAGIQGVRAAHEETEESAQAAEAVQVAQDVVEQEAEAAEAEQAAQDIAEDEPPIPVTPAPPPVVPAEAGTSQLVGSAWAAHEEAAEPAQATEAEPVADEAAPEEVEEEPATEEVDEVEEEAPEDVEEEEAVEEAAPAEPAAAAEDTSVMPLTPVRRIIAEHMARSSREIPAAWSMVEVDVTRLVRTRDALKAAFEERHGTPLTYLPFAASALAAVLREHPRLNARWDDGHITLNNRVNLAVAVSTEAGLMVPVLRDADTLSIAGIAAELRRLSDGARAGTLAIEDVQGGTFTLNNTGALGSVVSVPIINHPQAAIMTTEAIVKRPVVVEGDAIAVRSMMNLCLTFDHRVCDGAEAAAFLSAVKARLEVVDESIGLG
ncbi:MAG: 2-oxo acid dehydrogenase subunit E2 [Chloroflexi bacterium]|nr:2-oxo acid dehydrogenase subunit E2 [Chloroflexota bacterium]